ncbi:MAG: hypothetical protein ACFCVG_16950 [Kineosporiaceae bacterium]
MTLALALAGVLAAAACGRDAEDTADASATVTQSAAARVSATSTPSQTVASVSPEAKPSPTPTPPRARPTYDDLERALTRQIREDTSDWIGDELPAGTAQCRESGPLPDWTAVACSYVLAPNLEAPPILVSVFGGASYGWVLIECCDGEPTPEAYEPGAYCRDLILPPPDAGAVIPPDFTGDPATLPPDPEYHLPYGAAVFYWLAQGRPARMDADDNSRPCETVYPADEVAAYWDRVEVLTP